MIVLALTIIIFSGSATMFVFEDRFEIRSSAFLKVLNKKQIYFYKDLEYIEYSKAELNPMNLVYYVPGTNKENEYLIKYKEGKKEKYIRKIGGKEQSIQAIRLINKKIYEYHKKRPSAYEYFPKSHLK
jgi:hypothetical protein